MRRASAPCRDAPAQIRKADCLPASWRSLAGSKTQCLGHMDSGSVTRFNPTHEYPQGCTDYDRWRLAKVNMQTTMRV